jgi:uncharacterized heparinase superfamily protein
MTDEAISRRPAVNLPARALLYARTLRHLKARQVADQLRRRLLPRRSPAAPRDVGWRGLHPTTPFLAPPEPAFAPGTIRFLNDARPFSPDAPDWAAAAAPKLWRYNLHYFDYLHWRAFAAGTGARLVEDWIARVQPGPGDAWEPYPVSLRVVNWLKYLALPGAEEPPQRWLDSLALQLVTLEHDLEYHLLANHLLKNAKALALGGLFLAGVAAERWRRPGLALLAAQADEQFLPDGGHFERSPMYHCIGLEDLLDVLNVAAAAPGLVDEAEYARLQAAAARALRFLGTIRGGDGEIPLFNDSAFGIAPPAAALLDYGRRVLGKVADESRSAGFVRICLPDTGYFGYRDGGDSLIVDCGPVGPDYQPGHAHCDTLSYELYLDGRRVIVDSGVHDYEIGPLRQYLRSTAAHNTVALDDAEQSEIWGAFRVARRARPLRAELGSWEEGRLRFSGTHDGYARLPGRVCHEREIVMEPPHRWRINDRLQGAGTHRGASFIHLHPELDAVPEKDGAVLIVHGERPVVRIVPRGGVLKRLSGWYCPEFGRCHRNIVLFIEISGNLPLEFGYVLERPAGGHSAETPWEHAVGATAVPADGGH